MSRQSKLAKLQQVNITVLLSCRTQLQDTGECDFPSSQGFVEFAEMRSLSSHAEMRAQAWWFTPNFALSIVVREDKWWGMRWIAWPRDLSRGAGRHVMMWWCAVKELQVEKQRGFALESAMAADLDSQKAAMQNLRQASQVSLHGL